MGMFMCPSHDGCFNNDGAAFLRDLQNQMIPFADMERDVAEYPASSAREFGECSFTLCVFFGCDRSDEVFERK
jgi:hypothetical protein